jgi:hypothetical protein
VATKKKAASEKELLDRHIGKEVRAGVLETLARAAYMAARTHRNRGAGPFVGRLLVKFDGVELHVRPPDRDTFIGVQPEEE